MQFILVRPVMAPVSQQISEFRQLVKYARTVVITTVVVGPPLRSARMMRTVVDTGNRVDEVVERVMTVLTGGHTDVALQPSASIKMRPEWDAQAWWTPVVADAALNPAVLLADLPSAMLVLTITQTQASAVLHYRKADAPIVGTTIIDGWRCRMTRGVAPVSAAWRGMPFLDAGLISAPLADVAQIVAPLPTAMTPITPVAAPLTLLSFPTVLGDGGLALGATRAGLPVTLTAHSWVLGLDVPNPDPDARILQQRAAVAALMRRAMQQKMGMVIAIEATLLPMELCIAWEARLRMLAIDEPGDSASVRWRETGMPFWSARYAAQPGAVVTGDADVDQDAPAAALDATATLIDLCAPLGITPSPALCAITSDPGDDLPGVLLAGGGIIIPLTDAESYLVRDITLSVLARYQYDRPLLVVLDGDARIPVSLEDEAVTIVLGSPADAHATIRAAETSGWDIVDTYGTLLAHTVDIAASGETGAGEKADVLIAELEHVIATPAIKRPPQRTQPVVAVDTTVFTDAVADDTLPVDNDADMSGENTEDAAWAARPYGVEDQEMDAGMMVTNDADAEGAGDNQALQTETESLWWEGTPVTDDFDMPAIGDPAMDDQPITTLVVPPSLTMLALPDDAPIEAWLDQIYSVLADDPDRTVQIIVAALDTADMDRADSILASWQPTSDPARRAWWVVVLAATDSDRVQALGTMDMPTRERFGAAWDHLHAASAQAALRLTTDAVAYEQETDQSSTPIDPFTTDPVWTWDTPAVPAIVAPDASFVSTTVPVVVSNSDSAPVLSPDAPITTMHAAGEAGSHDPEQRTSEWEAEKTDFEEHFSGSQAVDTHASVETPYAEEHVSSGAPWVLDHTNSVDTPPVIVLPDAPAAVSTQEIIVDHTPSQEPETVYRVQPEGMLVQDTTPTLILAHQEAIESSSDDLLIQGQLHRMRAAAATTAQMIAYAVDAGWERDMARSWVRELHKRVDTYEKNTVFAVPMPQTASSEAQTPHRSVAISPPEPVPIRVDTPHMQEQQSVPGVPVITVPVVSDSTPWWAPADTNGTTGATGESDNPTPALSAGVEAQVAADGASAALINLTGLQVRTHTGSLLDVGDAWMRDVPMATLVQQISGQQGGSEAEAARTAVYALLIPPLVHATASLAAVQELAAGGDPMRHLAFRSLLAKLTRTGPSHEKVRQALCRRLITWLRTTEMGSEMETV